MDGSEFATDTINKYSELKGELVKAYNRTAGHTAKRLWLKTILGQVSLAMATNTWAKIHELTQDADSEMSTPKLKRVLIRTMQKAVGKDLTERQAVAAILAVVVAKL